jgi:hypothetical protein
LYLALGVAAFRDLRHPMVARAMDHPTNETPFDRQERLINRARLFLDAALATVGQAGAWRGGGSKAGHAQRGGSFLAGHKLRRAF